MKLTIDILDQRISEAMRQATGKPDCRAIVKPAADPKFGDYQANGVMALAKNLKTNPRELAAQVADNLDVSDICEKIEIAGPGFINLTLKTEYLSEMLSQIFADEQNLGIEKTAEPLNIVVDFSGPNIAKQMHVGHLRSTIIGDCICRMLEFLGHNVIRQNHIGDWGLQMGMLLAIVENFTQKYAAQQSVDSKGKIYVPSYSKIEEIENLYKDANTRFTNDDVFAQEARAFTYRLQNHDPIAITQWKTLKRVTLDACNVIYKDLNISLSDKDVRGESRYRGDLSNVVEELKEKNLADESDGAICVFPPGFKNKQGNDLPLIIRKSDGAFLYATTDLAAIRYRVDKLNADRIIYVTDSRQALHFDMVFAVARMADWAPDDKVELEHVTFGSVLGENAKPLKTRSGENVKLAELLTEAVEKAKSVVEQKNPDLSHEEKQTIANAVGIGAIKYADYSNNRTSDYIFSFDKMLSLEGNTAPYMQYAYARIRSIQRKASDNEIDIKQELRGIGQVNLNEPHQIDLAKHLCRYGEAVNSAAADYRPNYLTTYLYELAQKFSGFYTCCPVIKADTQTRPSRLLLCELTARIIGHGLSEILGIEVVDKM